MTNPWTAIWTQPREAVRTAIEEKRTAEMYLLAVLGGILYAFDNISERDLIDDVGLPGLIFLWLLLGAFSGIIGLVITPGILKWTGNWLGGTASLRDVQHAYAWSYVLLLPTFVGLFALIAVFGRAMFTSGDLPLEDSVLGIVVLLVYIVMSVVLVVWALVTFFRALAEVQGFSVWRALASAAIPFVALMVLIVGIALALQ